MQIYKVDPSHPDTSILREISDILMSGGVIAYPTDTYYGLGADIKNEKALRKLFDIKGRESHKPILILISDREDLMFVTPVNLIPAAAEKLMDNFWPGPMTIVFHALPSIPALLTGNTGKIGVRLPDNVFCRQLVKTLGRPITATSANISGMPSIARPEQVSEYFGNRIDALVDGGSTPAKGESTVVDISQSVPTILRHGCIPESSIIKVLSGELY